jgi:flagellar export protein FliJ
MFRLQKVLDHRRKREDELQQRLAGVTLARVQAEEVLAGRIAAEQARHQELSSLLTGGRVDAARIQNLGLLLEGAARAVNTQRDEVARQMVAEDQARARLTVAMMERKALDRLRDRHVERERVEANHREAVTLDEIAGARAARDRMRKSA